MTRRVPWYLVGSLVLVSLAGCGRGFFTVERDAWRAEAEAACMKSGTIKESATVVRVSPISGPGACGAEFPLKVAALGSAVAMSYMGELRPPGRIPNASSQPRWPINQQPNNRPMYGSQPVAPYPSQAARAPSYDPQPQTYPSPQVPMSLHAPGQVPPDDEDSAAFEHSQGGYPRGPRPPSEGQLYRESPRLGAPTNGAPSGPSPREPYSSTSPAPPLPRLGPERNDQVASIGPVAFKPAATLACPLVSALDRWIIESVQPAALRWFNQPVAEIRQISAYSCRGMNGNSNARISEHAFGNALDISAFTLADGRRISVKDGWRGLPEEQGFLRDIQGAACQMFNTVLAPGSNIYHYDHIHVDLMRRSSGRAICNPAAVSGELIAARASGGRYVGRDPAVTGSIGAKRRALSYRPSADDGIEDESHIKDNGR
ncbi:extensin family protein [Bradyrhizobium sp. LHD-71]|uniref:extensin-like domain-containing protein n=1 Tax=Bradyrhizobium sp. LHD-71 TaxID=3072141 RepID=UPI00280DAD6A|nr:extensin family protein [Bradyrhizobium sp. LHD-71]MDQ8727800.1 extensin family protein [Bradyrhizobium sp. LHD-71]